MKKIIFFLCFIFVIILVLLSFNTQRIRENLNSKITIEEDIKRDWKKWESISPWRRGISSESSGVVSRQFENWSESEEYLGIEIPNPLEDCDWLRNTTYLGKDLENLRNISSASHIVAGGWGNKDGSIRDLDIQSGYKNDIIQVTIGFIIPTNLEELNYSLGELFTDEEWVEYVENLDKIKALIDTGIYYDDYVSTAYQIQNNMKLHIQVRAKKEYQKEVDEAMNKVLDMFIETYRNY